MEREMNENELDPILEELAELLKAEGGLVHMKHTVNGETATLNFTPANEVAKVVFERVAIKYGFITPDQLKEPVTFEEVIKSGNFLILDTKTTGLEEGEIVKIAIIDSGGLVLIDTYIKPVQPIPADATRIHGITDEMVKDAPTWREIAPVVVGILNTRHVVVYNAVYDRKMMHKTADRNGMEKIEWKGVATFWCAMEAYAKFWGEWNSYRHNYKWQSLTNACRQQRLEVKDAHTALGDCLMTLALVRKMIDGRP